LGNGNEQVKRLGFSYYLLANLPFLICRNYKV